MKFKLLLSVTVVTLICSGQSYAFDMIRDANAKKFTKKVDHSQDDKRPVTNLQMKRPDNYPGTPQK